MQSYSNYMLTNHTLRLH